MDTLGFKITSESGIQNQPILVTGGFNKPNILIEQLK